MKPLDDKQQPSNELTIQQLESWLPLLEMFSDKEVLLHGAAGEDAMNVGDVLEIVRSHILCRAVVDLCCKRRASALSHGAATDSVPLGTISECPSCGGDGKLTTTPGQFGPCWRCGGSGRVMAYREEKEQFDAKMQKIGAFVAACNGEQPSSTRQSDVLVGRTQTALRRFDDNVDMGDPESVAAWWNKHGAPLLDTIDKAASSPASAIGAWITVEQMKADGTIYAIDISPEPPCLIQWKDGAWRFMGGMRCATVLEGVKRALQVMAPTDGSGHHG